MTTTNMQDIFDAILESDQRSLSLSDLAVQAYELGQSDYHSAISEHQALQIAVAIVALRDCDNSHDSHLVRQSLLNPVSAAGGKAGGKAKTAAKAAASKANGSKGGRPRQLNYMQALELLQELGAIAISTNAYDMDISDAIAAAHETSLVPECESSFNGPYIVDKDSLKVWLIKDGLRDSVPTCTGLTE